MSGIDDPLPEVATQVLEHSDMVTMECPHRWIANNGADGLPMFRLTFWGYAYNEDDSWRWQYGRYVKRLRFMRARCAYCQQGSLWSEGAWPKTPISS